MGVMGWNINLVLECDKCGREYMWEYRIDISEITAINGTENFNRAKLDFIDNYGGVVVGRFNDDDTKERYYCFKCKEEIFKTSKFLKGDID